MNEEHFNSSAAVDLYTLGARHGLTTAETLCIGQVPESARGSVLDIGVGAGRTVEPLSKIFRRYLGIDYSAAMVRAARRLFPASDIRIMDARNLDFTEPFDCIFFSFNGIDSIPHADRTLVFKSVSRLLRPGGYFLYSTHNIFGPRVQDWLRHFWVKELFLPARRAYAIPRRVKNRVKNFGRQSVGPMSTFAHINDPGDDFGVISTYVDPQGEMEMLQDHELSVVATAGSKKDRCAYDNDDHWIYFVARRNA